MGPGGKPLYLGMCYMENQFSNLLSILPNRKITNSKNNSWIRL